MKPKIPSTIDSPEITGLNTIISSYGKHGAIDAYISNCKRVGLPVEQWALRYLELYQRYTSEKTGMFIDVKAASRALREVRGETD